MTSRYDSSPASLRAMRDRLTAAAKREGVVFGRLQQHVGVLVVTQLFATLTDAKGDPLLLVKGGVSLELRRSILGSRTFKDLATVSRGDIDNVHDRLTEAGAEGWEGFTSIFTPSAVFEVPALASNAYCFTAKVSHLGKPFVSVPIEVSPVEAGNADAYDKIGSEALALVGLPNSEAVPCMTLPWQIAQKIHACTDPAEAPRSNDRAHGLVDLQLLEALVVDEPLGETRAACVAVFAACGKHDWPPTLVALPHWPAIYARALEGLEEFGLAPDVEQAVGRVQALLAGSERGVATAEHRVQRGDHQCRLLIEIGFADLLQPFFATPRRPFGLADLPVADHMRRDRPEGDATITSHGSRGAEQLVGVDALPGELDDVDVVAPAGAGDAAFEDGDALLGDRGLRGIAEQHDRIAQHPVDAYLSGSGHDRVSGGDVSRGGALPRFDPHADPYSLGGVVGLLADLPHADRVQIEHHPVVNVDRSDVTDHRDEVLGGDLCAHGVRVGVLRRATHPVGGQQDPAFEHEVLGVDRAGEPVQERLQGVPGQILLRRCTARAALRRRRPCCGLDAAEQPHRPRSSQHLQGVQDGRLRPGEARSDLHQPGGLAVTAQPLLQRLP